jgi:hypothetical protein
MDKKFEVRVVNLGWKQKKEKSYSVIEKATGNFAGDTFRNYCFSYDTDGLSKANEVARLLNSGKKVG